jgi:hypothetical protein
MANLDRNFNLAGAIEPEQEKEIKKALKNLSGINHVTANTRSPPSPNRRQKP